MSIELYQALPITAPITTTLIIRYLLLLYAHHTPTNCSYLYAVVVSELLLNMIRTTDNDNVPPLTNIIIPHYTRLPTQPITRYSCTCWKFVSFPTLQNTIVISLNQSNCASLSSTPTWVFESAWDRYPQIR